MSHQLKLYSTILTEINEYMFTTDANKIQQVGFYVHVMLCYLPYTIFVTTFDCLKQPVTTLSHSNRKYV